MKKRTAILLTTGMVGILLAGCGDSKTGDAKGSGSEKSDKVYEILMTRLRQSGCKICKKQATR